MDFDFDANINSISKFYDDIVIIKDAFFAALKSCNANLVTAIIEQTKNGGKLNKSAIVDIYKDAINQQNELIKNRDIIINKVHELTDYKSLLEYTNANAIINSDTKPPEGFDTMSPKIMVRDTVALYNLQYLQIFCKVLGIVIIIAIFFKYFSSITGMTSLPSIIPSAALPQAAAAASLPQAAST